MSSRGLLASFECVFLHLIISSLFNQSSKKRCCSGMHNLAVPNLRFGGSADESILSPSHRLHRLARGRSVSPTLHPRGLHRNFYSLPHSAEPVSAPVISSHLRLKEIEEYLDTKARHLKFMELSQVYQGSHFSSPGLQTRHLGGHMRQWTGSLLDPSPAVQIPLLKSPQMSQPAHLPSRLQIYSPETNNLRSTSSAARPRPGSSHEYLPATSASYLLPTPSLLSSTSTMCHEHPSYLLRTLQPQPPWLLRASPPRGAAFGKLKSDAVFQSRIPFVRQEASHRLRHKQSSLLQRPKEEGRSLHLEPQATPEVLVQPSVIRPTMSPSTAGWHRFQSTLSKPPPLSGGQSTVTQRMTLSVYPPPPGRLRSPGQPDPLERANLGVSDPGRHRLGWSSRLYQPRHRSSSPPRVSAIRTPARSFTYSSPAKSRAERPAITLSSFSSPRLVCTCRVLAAK